MCIKWKLHGMSKENFQVLSCRPSRCSFPLIPSCRHYHYGYSYIFSPLCSSQQRFQNQSGSGSIPVSHTFCNNFSLPCAREFGRGVWMFSQGLSCIPLGFLPSTDYEYEVSP